MDNFIFKGKSSEEFNGIVVNSLPPISKPPKRVTKTEIEGKDGDIIEFLGYEAYDKTIEITILEETDIDKLIDWLNGSGKLILSNEPTKYYNAEIIEQIDFSRLIKYEPIEIKFHIQPYKYLISEEKKIIEMQKTEKQEEITIKGSCQANMKLEVSGNSEQESREGYNLLKNTMETQTVNGVTFTKNADGSVKVNGTATGGIAAVNVGQLELITGNYAINGVSGGSSSTYFLAAVELGIQTLGSSKNGAESFSLDETKTVTARIYAMEGTTVNTTIYPMICSSSNSDKSYEPYGAMPSPEYPSPIRNVGDNGSADFKVQNKNIWIPTLQNNGTNITQVNCDILLIDDIYKFTATGTDMYLGEVPIVIGTNYIPKIGTLYEIEKHTALSVLITNEQFTKNFITFYDKNKKTISNKYKQTNKFKEDIPENAKYFSLRFGKSNATIGETYETKVDIRFDEDLIEDYTKHEEQTLHFPLAKVLHKGDYLADDGIHYKRKTIVLDGVNNKFVSNHSAIQTDTKGFYGLVLKNKDKTHNSGSTNTLKSNYFKEVSGTAISAFNQNDSGIWWEGNTNNCYVILDKVTLNDANNWLAEQYANGTPVTIEYELAEEEIEPYTAEQQEAYNKLKQLYSYEDVTHITCENDIKANIEASYFLKEDITIENKGYIESKPIITVYGKENIEVSLNNNKIFSLDMQNDEFITVDAEKEDAYMGVILKNRQMNGEFDKIKLQPGENVINWTGNLTKIEVEPKSRWL